MRPRVAPAFLVMALATSTASAFSVEGTVREAGTRRPVPGALVVATDGEVSTTTDDQGAFVLTFEDARQPETLSLEVDTSGYARRVEVVRLRRDRSTTAVDLYVVPAEVAETRVRERRSRDNVARGAHRIEENEVNELPGTYGDPAKAIENFPGMGRVVLSQGSLFIRGANPNESAVFVDDYEVPDLYHFTGSTSVINIPFVESVELVPGAFSARYGRSTGGVVTLKTRKLPTDDVHGFAKLDVIDGGAYVGVPIGSKIAVGASARRSFIDVLRNVQRQVRGTGDALLLVPTYWDYQLKLDWDTAPGHEMVVFAFGSGDREEYVSDGTGALDPYLRTNDSDFHRVSLRYSHNIGSGLTHVFTPVVGYARTTLVEQAGLRTRAVETFDAQLRDELTWRSGNARVLVGIDATARADQLRYGGLLARDDIREVPSADLSIVAGRSNVQLDTQRVTAGLYTEGTLEPIAGVTVTPGLRLESYFLDEELRVSLEPRFAGSWQIVPGPWGTLVRAAAGAVSRPPDTDELAVAHLDGRALGIQRALHLQGGLEQTLADRLTMTVNVFRVWRDALTAKSRLFPVPERIGEEAVYGDGSGQSMGIEALLRVGVPRRYFAWLTYSLARHERRDGPSPVAAAGTYVSPSDTTHLLGVVGQVYLPAGFRMGTRYRIATGMPSDGVAGAIFDADSGAFTPVPAPRGFARLPLFQALDLRVDWSTVLDWFELDLYADLVNLNTVFGRPTEGTLYNFDYTEASPRLGLPLIPAVGAKATF